jgi:hypothetical protein
VAIIAIAPMLWASGAGAEIIAPMAVPVLGGLLISDEVVDIFLPVRFYWVRRARWLKLQKERAAALKEKGEIDVQAVERVPAQEVPYAEFVSGPVPTAELDSEVGEKEGSRAPTAKESQEPSKGAE